MSVLGEVLFAKSDNWIPVPKKKPNIFNAHKAFNIFKEILLPTL